MFFLENTIFIPTISVTSKKTYIVEHIYKCCGKMRVIVVSGAGGTLGDDMVYSVIKDWLREFGITDVVLNPKILDGDKLIVGGCGIVYDEGVVMEGEQNPYRYQQYINMAKRFRIPILGLGIGWQGLPLTFGTKVWVENLNSMDRITVWNERTKKYFESIGVTSKITATTDLAFSLKPSGKKFDHYDLAFLSHPPMIVARDCWKPEWEKYLNVKFKEIFMSTPSVLLISFCPFFPFSVGGKTIINPKPRTALSMIQKSNVCITTTLHALISAATAGRKVLALYPPEPLKPKIRWMAAKLNVRRLPLDSTNEEILEGIEEARNDTPVDISKQLELNQINKKILRDWL